MNFKRLSFFAVVFSLIYSCSKVPITNRKRINFIPDNKIMATSFSQYDQFLKSNKLSTDIKKTKQIKDIGKRISMAVTQFMKANNMTKEAASYKWDFNLIEDKTVNAWCMPGGKVVFYTGIMPVALNENGIAAIMGHEIAHAFAKHGQERMSSAYIQQFGSVAVGLSTKDDDPKKQQIFNMAYGVGSQLGMLKFSRTHEAEADKLGMIFMIMAGYNPNEAIKVWKRMSKLSKSKTPEFLSTHPSNQTRIRDLTAFLPEAKKLAQQYSKQ